MDIGCGPPELPTPTKRDSAHTRALLVAGGAHSRCQSICANAPATAPLLRHIPFSAAACRTRQAAEHTMSEGGTSCLECVEATPYSWYCKHGCSLEADRFRCTRQRLGLGLCSEAASMLVKADCIAARRRGHQPRTPTSSPESSQADRTQTPDWGTGLGRGWSFDFHQHASCSLATSALSPKPDAPKPSRLKVAPGSRSRPERAGTRARAQAGAAYCQTMRQSRTTCSGCSPACCRLGSGASGARRSRSQP